MVFAWLRRCLAHHEPTSHATEYVPGLGIVPRLPDIRRWRLAGEYAARHRLDGPWWRKVCAVCGTRCEYAAWASAVLGDKAMWE